MKLYMFPVAPNPTRVMLYLAEKKHAGHEIPVEQVLVDFREKQQKSDEHLERNPFGKLPVLELDDGSFLLESVAIIEYLEDLYPDPPFIGSNPQERAETRSLERIIELGIQRPIGGVVHATDSPLGLPANPPVAEYFRAEIPTAAKHVDAILADGREFVMGDRLSIADFTLAAGLQLGRMKQIELEDCPNIARWDAAYRERPAPKEVMLL